MEASQRNGKNNGCRALPQDPRLMGRRQPTLHGNNTCDVPPCSCQRVEGGRTDCLPRLLAEFASAEPRGRHTQPFSWWGQKLPRKNYRSYTWRFTSCTDSLGLLLGNQCYLKRCSPPSKTTKGGKGKGYLQPWQGPIQKTPIPQKVVPLRKERKTAQWREVWPWYMRPTKKHWLWQLPSKKR